MSPHRGMFTFDMCRTTPRIIFSATLTAYSTICRCYVPPKPAPPVREAPPELPERRSNDAWPEPAPAPKPKPPPPKAHKGVGTDPLPDHTAELARSPAGAT